MEKPKELKESRQKQFQAFFGITRSCQFPQLM